MSARWLRLVSHHYRELGSPPAHFQLPAFLSSSLPMFAMIRYENPCWVQRKLRSTRYLPGLSGLISIVCVWQNPKMEKVRSSVQEETRN